MSDEVLTDITPVRDLQVQQQGAIVPSTPNQLLELAVRSGASVDQLERLMAMNVAWEKWEAEKASNKAFAAFKAEAIRILKTKKITDGPLKGKSHAELAEIVAAVSPALSQHGLSLSWRLSKDERDWMEVTCVLAHCDGHSTSTSMGGAPDTGPGRNAIQARGSTKTYLERYTATALLGLAAAEDDNDGAGGGVDLAQQELNEWTAKAFAAPSHAALDVVVRGGVAAFKHNKKSYTAFRTAVETRRVNLPKE